MGVPCAPPSLSCRYLHVCKIYHKGRMACSLTREKSASRRRSMRTPRAVCRRVTGRRAMGRSSRLAQVMRFGGSIASTATTRDMIWFAQVTHIFQERGGGAGQGGGDWRTDDQRVVRVCLVGRRSSTGVWSRDAREAGSKCARCRPTAEPADGEPNGCWCAPIRARGCSDVHCYIALRDVDAAVDMAGEPLARAPSTAQLRLLTAGGAG